MTAPYEPGDTVTTPNGPALVVAGWHNPADPHGEYVFVKHPKKLEIDPALATWTPPGASGVNGWVAVYRQEEVTK